MAFRRSSATRAGRGTLGGLGPGRRDGGHDPVGGHTARQGANVAVLEGSLAQGNLDRLFAVFCHAVARGQGEMYN